MSDLPEMGPSKTSAVFDQAVQKFSDKFNYPYLTDEQIMEKAREAEAQNVYGADAKKDRHGHYISQSIGAPGFETGNHYAAILKYEGRASWEKAVREIYKRDPDRAKALGLPQPQA